MKPQTGKRKALTVRPLKTSQTVGAVLAFQGMANAMPLLHGSQGCSAFTKVFFVRHFREPIPIQTTAMEQTSAIMGADDNLMEGLATLAAKSGASLIGVITTGLAATQGSDIRRVIRQFRLAHPQWNHLPIVPVGAPEFTGGMESGFALAVEALLEQLLTPRPWKANLSRRINVLAPSCLTAGDLEELTELLAAFDLEAAFLPDLSDALDGHLAAHDHLPVTGGGTPLTFFEGFHQARATLVIGDSLRSSSERIASHCPGMPLLRFDHLMGLDACDRLVAALGRLTQNGIPPRVIRWRQQLLDAMLDAHFHLGERRVAMAGERDLLRGFGDLLGEMGARIVAAVTPHAPGGPMVIGGVQPVSGDLDDLESLAVANRAELLIGSSHLATSAQRLGIPLLRAGFPLFDRLGAFRDRRIGYRGGRDTLFALANHVLESAHQGVSPYSSGLRPALAPFGAANDEPSLASVADSPSGGSVDHG